CHSQNPHRICPVACGRCDYCPLVRSIYFLLRYASFILICRDDLIGENRIGGAHEPFKFVSKTPLAIVRPTLLVPHRMDSFMSGASSGAMWKISSVGCIQERQSAKRLLWMNMKMESLSCCMNIF